MIQAIETVDTKGNITRHAAGLGGVRCGRGGTVMLNHTEPTIPSALKDIHCRRCLALVENDHRKLAARFKRRVPRLEI